MMHNVSTQWLPREGGFGTILLLGGRRETVALPKSFKRLVSTRVCNVD